MAFLTTDQSEGKLFSGTRRRNTWRTVIFLCSSLLLPFIARAATPESAEYQLKAVFLFNFAQFVRWPETAFRERESPLIIGVLGQDPFGNYLDKLIAGEKIEQRPLDLRRFSGTDDFSQCHILFISRSESGELDRIISRIKGRSILTVSDSDEFNRRGGMIRFVREGGKIRLRVNVNAAKEAQLTISSKLLRPATIVTSERE